jgi:hypothetical protein
MSINIQDENTGSSATYTKSGTAVALDVWDQSPAGAGGGGAGSTSLFDLSGNNLYFVDDNTVNVIGSVNVGDPATIGSYTSMALGSVAISNSPNVLLGSTTLHGIGSVLQTGSMEVYQTTNTDMRIIGSVNVDNAQAIGSYTTMALGSVAITNTPNVLLGSTTLHGVGSVKVITSTGSLEVFQTTAGDMTVTATVSSPATIGSYTEQVLGSVAITNHPSVTIGSVSTSATTTTGSIWVLNASTTIIGSNADRVGYALYNNGANNTDVALGFGADATLDDYIISPSTHFAQDGINVFGGDIKGIVSAGSEDIRFIEFLG